MAVLAGANGPTAIAKWAALKEEALRGIVWVVFRVSAACK
jgi:hypothetical protein